MKLEIVQHTTEPIPYDLLLLADPSMDMISKYLGTSEIFLAKENEDTLGILVLKTEEVHAEIMNVAVDEKHQGKGIGTKLINHAILFARDSGIKKVLIGTADTSEDQLRLYQKLGFSQIGQTANFFTEHYDEPIYENGKQARDMIRLEMSLS